MNRAEFRTVAGRTSAWTAVKVQAVKHVQVGVRDNAGRAVKTDPKENIARSGFVGEVSFSSPTQPS